jgi:hypothetical protein
MASVRTNTISWGDLGYVHHDLDDLDAPFTTQQIETVIKEMPPEKAPGPRFHRMLLQEMLVYNQRRFDTGADVFLQQSNVEAELNQHGTYCSST